MQPANRTYTAEFSPSPFPKKESAGKAEAQLSLILNELQSQDDDHPQVTTSRHNVIRALRGYRLTDLAALFVGFFGAWGLAYAVNALFYERYNLGDAMEGSVLSISQSLLVGVCLIVWFGQNGHYRMRMPYWTETKKIIEAMSVGMLVDIFLRGIVKQDFSRLWLISGWGIATLSLILFRSLWRDRMRKQGLWSVAAILVGRGATAEEARRALASEAGLGYAIVAQLDNLQVAFQKAGNSWQRLCGSLKADYVIIALEGTELANAGPAFAQLLREDVPFSVAPPLHCVPVYGMTPQYFFNHDTMLLTHNHGLNQRLPCVIKRTFDVVLATTGLLALSPILVLVAFLIRMDGGAAMFGHKRLGMNGRYFSCLKFRSMIVNSDAVLKKYLAENEQAREEWQREHKLRNDPRVTRLGKILRRTSIDELPQLLNVLLGDMSIVGPRPIIVAETEKYDNDISHYYRVRPGITGLWQVSGRNDVSYAERVRMDSWYVRNWSLWHDIVIVCKTFGVVLKGRGAY